MDHAPNARTSLPAPDVAGILRKHRNIDVVLGTVTDVDPDAGILHYRHEGPAQSVHFRYLIASTGATQSYFGRDEFARYSYSLKTIDDATDLRTPIRECFEVAAQTEDADLRRRLPSFVLVGAGPTGVEVLAEATGSEADRAGRFLINDDLTVGGYANVYAIGDI